jgi:hypothetical protein
MARGTPFSMPFFFGGKMKLIGNLLNHKGKQLSNQ